MRSASLALLGRPAADLRNPKPDDQWGKGLAVCADTLYGSDHLLLHTSTSIIPEIISAD
jgi:hypothetical protein